MWGKKKKEKEKEKDFVEVEETPDLEVPIEEPEETGFIQYQTSVGGNVVTNLLGETLDAVGLGGLNAFLIDFPSPFWC